MRRLGGDALNAAVAAECLELTKRFLNVSTKTDILTADTWKVAVQRGSMPLTKLLLERTESLSPDDVYDVLESVVDFGSPELLEVLLPHVEPLTDTLITTIFDRALRRSAALATYLLETHSSRILPEFIEYVLEHADRIDNTDIKVLLRKYGLGTSRDE